MRDEDGFCKFWESYPKKRSKGDAYKAWCVTGDKRPAVDTIIKAITVLKASPDWTKDGGQYIPYPSTWLRAWGWEDVPEVDLKGVIKGKMWWETVTGIEQKGGELGLLPEHFELGWQHFKAAVFRAAGHNVTEMPVIRDKKLESAGS